MKPYDDIDWTDVQLFWCRAMGNGWASTEWGFSSVPPYRFEEDGLILRDNWTQTPDSPKSSGMTVIYKQFNAEYIPIWAMNYWGSYERTEIPLLKLALRNGINFTRNRTAVSFLGCRGPVMFKEATGQRKYLNKVDSGSRFENFSGEEMIVEAASNNILGSHKYVGQVLTPPIA